jgi:hypothetical protein
MPLISHEIPKQLFPIHDIINDYPYVLGHLLNLDKDYAYFYKKKLENAPFSILDNSAFELGKSIPFEELHQLSVEYKPTHLVLPDVVNNYEKTRSNAVEYINQYRDSYDNPLEYIGVCQGNSFEEIAECIDLYIINGVDIIALPFDLIRESEWVTVRYRFLKWWIKNHYNKIPDWYSSRNIKLHLLGCQNPIEFALYKDNPIMQKLIFSLDTSSPIINGWIGNKFLEDGLITEKPKAKLADNLDIKLNEKQLELISYNIRKFKSYVK